MRAPSWLFTCSTSTSTSTSTSVPHPNYSLSDSTTSTSSSSPSSSDSSSISSLHTSLSLQTLPSVPSLQNLSPQSLNLYVSHTSTSSLHHHPLPVTSLFVQRNLLYVASAHRINVYDRATFALLDVVNDAGSSSGYVKSLSSCDGRIFTAHQDSKIRVWKITEAKRHKLSTVLPTIDDRLRRFLLPKNYVAIRRHKKLLWIEHADAITGLAVSNGFIYSVSWDKYFKMWSAEDLRCLDSVKAHDDAINAVVVSTDGTVYTGSADYRIRVWTKPVRDKRHLLIATLEKHKSAVNALALNDDGSVLFSGACDRSILVWEREDSANHMVVSGALRGHKKAILSLLYVSDLLFSGSSDRMVRIWQRGHDGNYCCLAVLEGHHKPVKSLAAVRDDGDDSVVSVYSGSLDGEVKAWRVTMSRACSAFPCTPVEFVKS
ncbi:hypothetical protein K2173_002686 [Erythroxylum novogranatense]|uniref:Uncharacterized protein n=1 Tax=Erythroxylum novogranatense TaxID=1862640 RepID=A0AAV8SWR6_9ROSI|nr:hypothetical protein K2173_002686 [Erythroxylum novogranatense]